MMLSPKAMSEAIRSKRKKLKEDGVENMVDTAALPQMNPQDVLNLKQKATMQDTMGIDESDKSMASDDPADASMPADSSQDMDKLKRQMARVERILGTLSVG
jgi:hypothetical protein